MSLIGDCVYSAQLLECVGLPPNSLAQFSIHFVTEHELATKERRRVADIEPATSIMWSVDAHGRCEPPAAMTVAASHHPHQHTGHAQGDAAVATQALTQHGTLLSANAHRPKAADVRELRVTLVANRTRGAHDGLASPPRRARMQKAEEGREEEEDEKEKETEGQKKLPPVAELERQLWCPVHDPKEVAAIEKDRRRWEEDEAALAKLYGDTSKLNNKKSETGQEQQELAAVSSPTCICSASLIIDETDLPAASCAIGGVQQLFGAKWLTLTTKKNAAAAASSSNGTHDGQHQHQHPMRIRVAWSCSGLATKHSNAVQFASADTPTHAYLHNSFLLHHHHSSSVPGSKTQSCGALSSGSLIASSEQQQQLQEPGKESTPASTNASLAAANEEVEPNKEKRNNNDAPAAGATSAAAASLDAISIASSVSRLEQMLTEFARNFHSRLSSLEGRIQGMERQQSIMAAHLCLEAAPPSLAAMSRLGSVIHASEALAVLQMQQQQIAQQQQQQIQKQSTSHAMMMNRRSSDVSNVGNNINNNSPHSSSTSSGGVRQGSADVASPPTEDIRFTAVDAPLLRSASSSPNAASIVKRRVSNEGRASVNAIASNSGGTPTAQRPSSSSSSVRGNHNNNSNNQPSSVLTYNSNNNNNNSNNNHNDDNSATVRSLSSSGRGARLATAAPSQKNGGLASSVKQQSSSSSARRVHIDASACSSSTNNNGGVRMAKQPPQRGRDEGAEEEQRSEVDFQITGDPRNIGADGDRRTVSSSTHQQLQQSQNSPGRRGAGSGSAATTPSSPPPRILLGTPNPVIYTGAPNAASPLVPASSAAVPDSALRAIYSNPTTVSLSDQQRLAEYQPPQQGHAAASTNGSSPLRSSSLFKESGRGAGDGRNSGAGGAGVGLRGGLVVGSQTMNPLALDSTRFASRMVTSEDDELMDPAVRFPIRSFSNGMN